MHCTRLTNLCVALNTRGMNTGGEGMFMACFPEAAV